MKKKSNEELRQLAETVGALQDTLRVHSDALENIVQYQYGVIISLDLIYMDIVSMLPKKIREDILQNKYDESLSGAENDVVALKQIRDYLDKRIEDCRNFILSESLQSANQTAEKES